MRLTHVHGPWRYRPEVRELLWQHGANPSEHTPPSILHDFVSDLYRYELRRLRDALVRHQIPREGYADRVVSIRRRYLLVSLVPQLWVEP